ncbi:MAG: hypothetical protein ACTSUE_11120 [Promethearchaeota archaeon]
MVLERLHILVLYIEMRGIFKNASDKKHYIRMSEAYRMHSVFSWLIMYLATAWSLAILVEPHYLSLGLLILVDLQLLVGMGLHVYWDVGCYADVTMLGIVATCIKILEMVPVAYLNYETIIRLHSV